MGSQDVASLAEGRRTVDQGRSLVQLQRTDRPGSDLEVGSNKMVADTAGDRRVAVAGMDTVGKAAHEWLSRGFERGVSHQTPDLDVIADENELLELVPAGMVGWTLEAASVDGTVAAAAVGGD